MTKRKGETVKLTLPVSERDHIQGSLTAPVTLVEYGDYECPYCAQAYLITKEVQERLGTKLGFVFRNFPVTKLRPNSYQVTLAQNCSCSKYVLGYVQLYLFKHGQVNTDDNLMLADEPGPRHWKV